MKATHSAKSRSTEGDCIVKVTLVVKGGNMTTAQKLVNERIGKVLNDWFTEDLGSDAPFDDGSLLWWTTGPNSSEQ